MSSLLPDTAAFADEPVGSVMATIFSTGTHPHKRPVRGRPLSTRSTTGVLAVLIDAERTPGERRSVGEGRREHLPPTCATTVTGSAEPARR